MLFLDIITIVCVGLMTGVEFAVSAFVNPVLWKLEERSQAFAISLFAKKLGTVMPFWYAVGLVLLVAEAIIRRHQGGAILLFTACGIWAAVILLTMLFLVPINNRMMRLSQDAFEVPSRQQHKKWDTLHRLRIAVLIVAMVCFLGAIL